MIPPGRAEEHAILDVYVEPWPTAIERFVKLPLLYDWSFWSCNELKNGLWRFCYVAKESAEKRPRQICWLEPWKVSVDGTVCYLVDRPIKTKGVVKFFLETENPKALTGEK